ncbi:Oxygen-independent coproporphyrinogen-III oxidase-like protein YqeR [bioreactor metagenome]|uniref:Oxygen-independent coproporphyrinogen-III oxidase-like protein YqeR n=1 Tax=bioreactor metagenome TaxID=1076179 RepID=A0A644T8T6_9ZZZZ|nr:radical SAM family heme chaperone HemW [Negativicutes bacterium]
MKIGLYIHIPFCQQKCLYCDFPSYANMDYLYNDYVTALCREIAGQGGLYAGQVVDTVYIGGGTPSLLSNKELAVILDSVMRSFNLAIDAEVSIEANPGTINKEKLALLKGSGVNRISFGVQSFSDSLLQTIGRIHTAAEAIQAVNMAHQTGFENINVDLMYGLPGQTTADVGESINIAAALSVEHLSIYGLKVEAGTPFAELYAHGKLGMPSEDVDEDMYDLVASLTSSLGYERYEISNYARKGYACKHNLKYWHYQPYIGIGASAHSFQRGERMANTGCVTEYIRLINEGHSTIGFSEKVVGESAMAEFIFLALRTVRGLKYEHFNNYFNADFFHKYGAVISDLEQRKLITIEVDGIRLTEFGMKYGNVVFVAFLD